MANSCVELRLRWGGAQAAGRGGKAPAVVGWVRASTGQPPGESSGSQYLSHPYINNF